MRDLLAVQLACCLLLVSAFGQKELSPPRTPADVTQRLREERSLQKKPKDGYVPDASTAVRIAEAVLIPVYGADQIGSEKPFNATLDSDVWTISGTLHCKTTATSVCVGGTAVGQLSKSTAEVLLLVHEE
jgi:hypothetical protein